MAKDISGSLRKLTIEGQPFRVMADGNLTEIITKWENSHLPTSGRAMRKMMKRIPAREGLPLATNSAERATLKNFAESMDDLKCTYVNAAGDTYRCVGSLEIENSETEENRTNCQILPYDDWDLAEG